MGKTLVKVVATPVGRSHEKIVAHFDDGTTEVLRARATLNRGYRWAAHHSRHGSLEAEVTLHARRDLAVPYRALACQGHPHVSFGAGSADRAYCDGSCQRRDTVTVVEVTRG